MMRVWGPMVALALTLGCTAVLDPGRHQGGQRVDGGAADAGAIDAGAIDGGAPDGSTDAADAGRRCDPGLRCVPRPAGWSGPIIVVSGPGEAAAPACPSVAPSTAFEGHSGLTAPPASCECACEPPPDSELSCSAVTVDTPFNCFVLDDPYATVARGGCTSVSGMPSSGQWRASSSTLSTSAACAAVPTEEIAPPIWEASHRGCSFGEPAPCGDGVCAPSLEAGQRLCVYAEGEADCPAGFPDMRRIAEGITDERGCSECSCGAVEGECTGSVVVASGCGGGTVAYASIPVGGCVGASSHPSPVALHGSFSPTASCPPSEVMPTGEITLEGVRTLCCTPD